MTSKKAATLLKQCSDILALFGDVPIEKALDEIYELCLSKKGISTKKKSKVQDKSELLEKINDELILKLSKMNGDELNNFLLNNDLFKTKEALIILADKLNIITGSNSKRYNFENLRHYIINYFERLQINNIIKNDRQ